jgi:hypothetical protein
VDEAHAPHVGSQVVDLIGWFAIHQHGCLGVCLVAQIQQQEFVRNGGRELVLLDVDPSNKPPRRLELVHQVAADEATGATDNGGLHCPPSSPCGST